MSKTLKDKDTELKELDVRICEADAITKVELTFPNNQVRVYRLGTFSSTIPTYEHINRYILIFGSLIIGVVFSLFFAWTLIYMLVVK